MIVLQGRSIAPGHARGVALVSSEPISFLGGVSLESSVVIEKGHELQGKPLKGSILCFPHGRGSTVGSYVLYSLAKRGLVPAAIVNRFADPVVAVGALIAGIPMVDRIDISKIKSGDEVEVNGDEGLVKILSRKEG